MYNWDRPTETKLFLDGGQLSHFKILERLEWFLKELERTHAEKTALNHMPLISGDDEASIARFDAVLTKGKDIFVIEKNIASIMKYLETQEKKAIEDRKEALELIEEAKEKYGQK